MESNNIVINLDLEEQLLKFRYIPLVTGEIYSMENRTFVSPDDDGYIKESSFYTDMENGLYFLLHQRKYTRSSLLESLRECGYDIDESYCLYETEDLRKLRIKEVKKLFEELRTSNNFYFYSSLGFQVLGNSESLSFISSLNTHFDMLQESGKIVFKDYGGSFHLLSKTDIETLYNEITISRYSLIYQEREYIDSISKLNREDLESIRISYVMDSYQ